jgi:hypothetical protein
MKVFPYSKVCQPLGSSNAPNVDGLNSLNGTISESMLQQQLFEESVELYGVVVSYFTHGYSLSTHDFIYGEDVTASFSVPVQMKALIEYNQDSLLLSKFGIMNDADLTIIVPIKTFNMLFSATQSYPEPKSGDLIRVDQLGISRPSGGWEYINNIQNIIKDSSGITKCKNPEEYQEKLSQYLSSYQTEINGWLRSAPVFEVTERRDLAPQLNINRLLGVYAWHIKAKRYDYSFEPKAPIEKGSDQVSDGTFFGRLSGGENPKSPDKKYPQNAEEESKKIFDYNNRGNLDSVYGDY